MPAPASNLEKSTISLDSFPERAVTSLYDAAIGPINTGYYLPLFTRFEAADRTILSWNWAAGLCTLFWMIFRNLWGSVLVYVTAVTVVPLLILGLGRLVFHWIKPVELGVMLTCLMLSVIVPGLVGNTLFYRKCRREIANILATSATLNDACGALSLHASSRKRLIMTTGINIVLFAMALLLYVLTFDSNNVRMATHIVPRVSVPAPSRPRTPSSSIVAPALPAVSFPVTPIILASAPTATITSAPVLRSLLASEPLQPTTAASTLASLPVQPASSLPPMAIPAQSAPSSSSSSSKTTTLSKAVDTAKKKRIPPALPAITVVSASAQPVAAKVVPVQPAASTISTVTKVMDASQPQSISSALAVTSAPTPRPTSAPLQPASASIVASMPVQPVTAKALPVQPAASKMTIVPKVAASQPQRSASAVAVTPAPVPGPPVTAKALPVQPAASKMTTAPQTVAVSQPQRNAAAMAVTPAPASAPKPAAAIPAPVTVATTPETVVASAPQHTPLLSTEQSQPIQQTHLSAPLPTVSPGYYINVGLFADEKNAINAHARLQAAGLPALIQHVRIRNRALVRVRVGPLANRSLATETVTKIHALKLDATLVR